MLKIPVLGQLARLGEALGGGIAPIVYLLLDQFTTNQGAPITTPRTCEPGPGTLVFVQNDGAISIESGELKTIGQTTSAWGDQGFYSQSTLARAIGRAFIENYRIDSGAGAAAAPLVLAAGTTLNYGGFANIATGLMHAGALYAVTTGGTKVDLGFNFTQPWPYVLGIVLQSTGALFFIRYGEFTEWTLLWRTTLDNTANLYLTASSQFSLASGVISYIDNLAVTDLPAPFDTDYGLVTTRLAGARSAGDTFTHEADCIIEFTLTALPSAGNYVEVRFREQDATNYWNILVDSAGVLTLNEVVNGSSSVRVTQAGLAANRRVGIIMYGQTIRGVHHDTYKWQYTSAANFATSTAGRIASLGPGGGISNLNAWPRKITGTAKTVLTSVLQGTLPSGFNLYEAVAPNAAAALANTPTYDGSGQAIHPSVYDAGVGNTWNGHRYWMAMTPYPNNNADLENPSILASDDGNTWVVPDGLTNPVIPHPAGTGGFNSDPELVMVGSTLYMIYRTSDSDSTPVDHIRVVSSTDGVTWGDAASLFSVAYTACMSPSVIYDGSQYVMYSVNATATPSLIERRTAPAVTGPWSDPATVWSANVGSARAWHMDAILTDSRYILMVSGESIGPSYLMQSTDGVTFTIAPRALLSPSTGWDKVIYRATMVRTTTGFDVWYSAWNNGSPAVWGTGRTSITVGIY